MMRQKDLSGAANSFLLAGKNCIGRRFKILAFFNLNKNDVRLVFDNQVNLAGAGTAAGNIIAGDKNISLKPQILQRYEFGRFTAQFKAHF